MSDRLFLIKEYVDKYVREKREMAKNCGKVVNLLITDLQDDEKDIIMHETDSGREIVRSIPLDKYNETYGSVDRID